MRPYLLCVLEISPSLWNLWGIRLWKKREWDRSVTELPSKSRNAFCLLIYWKDTYYITKTRGCFCKLKLSLPSGWQTSTKINGNKYSKTSVDLNKNYFLTKYQIIQIVMVLFSWLCYAPMLHICIKVTMYNYIPLVCRNVFVNWARRPLRSICITWINR